VTSDYGIDDAALEQRIAELGDDEFDRLVERTRPPTLGDHIDPVAELNKVSLQGLSYRELREHIARKSAASRELTHRRANGGGPPANAN
jgi:hypothetical protein